MYTSRKFLIAGLALVAATMAVSAPSVAESAPFNRVVIVVDASGSYKARQPDAIAKAGELLAGLSERKQKRWDRPDEVLIVSLDAAPEVIWKGTPAELAAANRADWIARFRGRSDFAKCTDVAAALNLAADELHKAPAATAQYLYVFSDLVDERPLDGPSACAAPRQTPGDDVAWDRLEAIRIAAFWLPASQKMAWDEAMKSHGLTSYRLLSTSESGVNRIEIPEPAKREVTSAERQQGRDTLVGVAQLAGTIAVAGLGLVLLAALASSAIARRRRPTSPRAPASGGSRSIAVRGPVAPMRIPPKS
jgi:hypothetical protein